jgi:hypothetical protein
MAAKRVGNADEHDRNGSAKPFHGRHAQRTAGENNIRRQRHQLRSVFCLRVESVLAPTKIDLEIAADAPAGLL